MADFDARAATDGAAADRADPVDVIDGALGDGSVAPDSPAVDSGQQDTLVVMDVSAMDAVPAGDVPGTVDVPPTVDVPVTLDVVDVLDIPDTIDVPPAADAPFRADAGPCPTGMVLIPGGTFTMGDSDTTSFGAQPPHSVTLSAFCVDVTEVTVAAYRACTGCTAPDTSMYCNWSVSGRDTHPINCVDWNQAQAYCRSRGGDLPTEAQWEFAARGTDGRICPWGSTTPASQLCWSRHPSPGSTCPVQSYPSGTSPYGLFDMAGSVREWTLDWYADYSSIAVSNPTGPTSGSNRVYRGGSWDLTSATYLRAAYRRSDGPSYHNSDLGFRCARPPL